MANFFQNTINSAREKFDKGYKTFIRPVVQARQDFKTDLKPGGFVGFTGQTAQKMRPYAQFGQKVAQQTVQNVGNMANQAGRTIKTVASKLENPYGLTPEQQNATATPQIRLGKAVAQSAYNTGRDFVTGTFDAARSSVDQKRSFIQPYKKMMSSGVKIASAPLAAGQAGTTLALGGISGALNAALGDKKKANRFETGFAEGVTSAGAYKAVGMLTNPIIDKVATKLMESKTVLNALQKVPEGKKQQFVKFLAERASVGALNVPEGVIMQGSVRPDVAYTVQDALLDFTAGFAGGKNLSKIDVNTPKADLYGGREAFRGDEKVMKEGFNLLTDKLPRFEIDDSQAKLVIPRNFKGQELNLEQILDHSKLYESYPDFRKQKIAVEPLRPGVQGLYDGTRIKLDSKFVQHPTAYNVGSVITPNGVKKIDFPAYMSANDRIKSVLLHELDHKLQDVEGFAPGSNPSQFSKDSGQIAQIESLIKEQIAGIDRSTDPATRKDLMQGLEDLQNQKSKLEREPIDMYLHSAGEVSARDVQARMNLTPEQRRTTMPLASQGIPVKDMIVDKGTGSALSAQNGQKGEFLVQIKQNGIPVTERMYYSKKDIEEDISELKAIDPSKLTPQQTREKLGKIMYETREEHILKQKPKDDFISEIDDYNKTLDKEMMYETVRQSKDKVGNILVNRAKQLDDQIKQTTESMGQYQEYLQPRAAVEKPQLLQQLEMVAGPNSISQLILDARKVISKGLDIENISPKSNEVITSLIRQKSLANDEMVYGSDILNKIAELPLAKEIRDMNALRAKPTELKTIEKKLTDLTVQKNKVDRQIESTYKSMSRKAQEAPIIPPEKTYTPKEYEKIKAERDLSLPPPPPKAGEIPSTEYIEHMAKGYNGRRPDQKVGLFDWVRTPTKVLEKLGLKQESDLLLKQYDSYLTDFKKEIDRITDWQKQVPDPNSSQRIFNNLDGALSDKALTPDELKVAKEIKVYMSKWADKLGLPNDGRIASYITHIFEQDFITKEFDEDIAKLLVDRIPGSVYDPFLQQRLGKKGYIQDVWRALDAYVKRATRKVNMDPALEQLQKAGESLDTDSFEYVKSYAKRINMQPTQLDNYIDNTIKSVVGYKLGQRPVANLSQKGRQMIFRGALGLNFGSAIRNLTQGVNTYAALGEKYTAKGYMTLFKNLASNNLKELYDNNILQQSITQDRKYNAVKSFWEKADSGLFFMFDLAEKINRGSAYFGAKSKGLSKGMSEAEAIKYAKEIISKTQFNYGSIETPVALQSDIVKLFGQFQTFGIKQTEFVAGMVQQRDIAALARFGIGTFLVTQAFQKLFGLSTNMYEQLLGVAGKPLESAVNTITGQEEQQNKRFQGPPITQVAGAVTKIPSAIGGDKYAQEDLKKATALVIPGGVQVKKTLEGTSAYNQGASQTPKGQVRYRINQTPENRIKTSLFGQYSTPEASEYFNEKKKPYSDNQSALIKELGAEGEQMILDNRLKAASRKEAITAINTGDTKKAQQLMQGMTPEQKESIERSAKLEKIKSEFTPEQWAISNLTAEQKEQLSKNPKYAEMISDVETKIKSVSKSKSRRLRSKRSKKTKRLRSRKGKRTRLSKRVKIKRPSFG